MHIPLCKRSYAYTIVEALICNAYTTVEALLCTYHCGSVDVV